ncbi:MAG: hypothetical protein RL430_1297 [Actinomycetota bacterium]
MVPRKARVSRIASVVGAFAAVTLSSGFDAHVSAVAQGVQNVAGLGSTYVDTTTDGGDWYLVGYGASGNVGRLDSQNGTFNAAVRTGSATLNASTFVQGATEVAFAWTAAGGSLPTGGIDSYDKAVSFVLPTASSMTLTGAASPTAGSGAGNFSIVGTSADQSTIRVRDIVGTSGLPKYMFMRNKTLGARYGTSYGVASNPQINNQLDWNPDGQNFSAVYAGHDGSTGYVTTGGTANGYTPATMSIWLRKPSECTESPVASGSRRVVKFVRLGTCTWTPPAGLSSVDVLVVAGGGGAGDGGGGAGGVLEQAAFAVSGPVSVTVGQGGAGSRFHFVRQVDNGRPSKFDTIVSSGGGGGGQYGGSTFGASGASGGGASADYTNAANKSTGIAGQGYGGGVSCAGGYGGPGGGGGAGGVGQNGGPTASANNQCTGANTGQNPTRGGNGGDGVQSSITGASEWYGGGGDAEGRGGDGGNGVVIIAYTQPVVTTTTSTIAPTTTVRSSTTTLAPALEIVVNAPGTTLASSASSIAPGVSAPVVVSQSSVPPKSSATSVGPRASATVTTSTTIPNNAGGTVAKPLPKPQVVTTGEAGIQIAGKTQSVEVTRADNQLVVSAGPLKAVLGAVNPDGSVRPLDTNGNVRLKAGDTVRIKLTGFKPLSIVEAWLFSTPQLMGTAEVGADGTVIGTFTIPKNAPTGAHRIAIVARTTDGKPATLTVGVKVGDWKKERSITIWLIVLPIVLAVIGALTLPATRRRRRTIN